MAFGLIIIGDEILSGRRVDKHFPKVLELLTQRGLSLAWAEYIGDDPVRITDTLRRTMRGNDVVLCTGGIGATPDDHTRQCAARAFGVDVMLHPEAKRLIQLRISEQAVANGEEPDFERPDNLQRLKMGEFPVGSEIIPNPYNRIPGFSLQHASLGYKGAHYFAPGFPVMAWPMFEWVLDTHYSSLFHQTPYNEQSVLVFGSMESLLTPLMEKIEAEFPGVKVFSLPHVGDQNIASHIDLGVKGEPVATTAAFELLQTELRNMRVDFRMPTL